MGIHQIDSVVYQPEAGPSGAQRDWVALDVSGDATLQAMATYERAAFGNTFNRPTNAFQLSTGELFGCHYSDDIARLDATTGEPLGRHVNNWGPSEGTNNPEIRYCVAAAEDVTNNRIALCSNIRDVVKVFDLADFKAGTLTLLYTIGTHNSAGNAPLLNNPWDVCLLPNGNWLVCNYLGNHAGGSTNDGALVEYSGADGSYVATRVANAGTPTALDTGDGRYIRMAPYSDGGTNYVAVQSNTYSEVIIVDVDSWSIVRRETAIGFSPIGMSVRGRGIRRSSAGGFFLSCWYLDSDARAIVEVTDDFTYVRHVGYRDSGVHALGVEQPWGFIELADGSLLVADYSRNAWRRMVLPASGGSDPTYSVTSSMTGLGGAALGDITGWSAQEVAGVDGATLDLSTGALSIPMSSMGSLLQNSSGLRGLVEKA